MTLRGRIPVIVGLVLVVSVLPVGAVPAGSWVAPWSWLGGWLSAAAATGLPTSVRLDRSAATFTAGGSVDLTATVDVELAGSGTAAGAPTPSGVAPVLGFQGMPAAAGDDWHTPLRAYDPASGAFTGPDPKFLSSGPAWNAPGVFANNNPAVFTDPTGADALDDVKNSWVGYVDGVADSLFLGGLVRWQREHIPGIRGLVDYCSDAYRMGSTTGNVVGLIASLAAGAPAAGRAVVAGAARAQTVFLAARTELANGVQVARAAATAISTSPTRVASQGAWRQLLADQTGTLKFGRNPHTPPSPGTGNGIEAAANTIARVGGHSIDDLSRAASVVDRYGLSGAGRALQKHGDRAGSVFPRSTGTAAERNAQGQAVVDDILTDPRGTSEVLDNVMNVWDSSGRGVRFRTDGTFMGFLEPR